MHDISDLNKEGLPTSASLIKATVIALLVGGLVLVVAVLPAEYGVDPTGLGSSMGLNALSAANAEEQDASGGNLLLASSAALGPVWKSAAAYRSDTLSLTLQPDEGTEVKAMMQEGDRFVFSWEAMEGGVNFDMHGEPPGSVDTFTSYWKGRNQVSAHGEFVAPFTGTHGWYWRNRNKEPVTITLSTSGYYEKLYQL
ncbi:hypothetical protein [Ketobacter sp.]|uniref:hypothetical protein n=1 Tax=Ketobacter sp. TaxID=2083498 RepID=UPI000F24BF36|nr:hypothetical protein [Ketobacter sp.]RLT96806.1 MAG: hypothetical protein D9N14_12260 [Ketobacter sp.]